MLKNNSIDLTERAKFIQEVREYNDWFHQQYPIDGIIRVKYSDLAFLVKYYGFNPYLMDDVADDVIEDSMADDMDIDGSDQSASGDDIQNSIDEGSSAESNEGEFYEVAPQTYEERLQQEQKKQLEQQQKKLKEQLDVLKEKKDNSLPLDVNDTDIIEYPSETDVWGIDLNEFHHSSQKTFIPFLPSEEEYEGKYVFTPSRKDNTHITDETHPDLPVIEIETPYIDPHIFNPPVSQPSLPEVPVPESTGALLLAPIKGHVNPGQLLYKTMARMPKTSEAYKILRALMPKPVIVGGAGNQYMLQKPITSYPALKPSTAGGSGGANKASTANGGKGKRVRVNGGKTFFLIMAWDVGAQSLERRINNMGGDGSYAPTFKNIDSFLDNTTQTIDELGGMNPGGHYMPMNELYFGLSTGIKTFVDGTNFILLCGNDGLYHTVNFFAQEKPLPKEFYPVRALNSVLGTTIKLLGGDLAREKAEMEAFLKKNPIIPIETSLLAKLPPKLKFLYIEYKQSLKRDQISCISGKIDVGVMVDKQKDLPKSIFGRGDHSYLIDDSSVTPTHAMRVKPKEVLLFSGGNRK